jgi:serine/threonine-protein kinase
MEIEAADKTITCPTCGIKYSLAAKFCGQDGTPLNPREREAAVKAAVGKECPVCREIYPPYALYCPHHAKKLLDVNDPSVAPASSARSDGDLAGSAKTNVVARQDDNVIGSTIGGKYRVESLIGEGGMAQVFKATHLDIEKPVVIKIMHANLPGMKNAYKRFERERTLTAKLDHPNIVSVFDGGQLDGKRPYIVMEYIEGDSLRSLLGEGKSNVPIELAISVLIQMCSGLQVAHKAGIVHRDLKPENIMLRSDSDRPDWVKIVDFGIAHLKEGGQKLTATGVAVGTVDYMSPEYLSDKPIDHRADIYAMGIILFELITGRCPFESESPEAVMAKHLWTPPSPPSRLRQDIKPGGILDAIVLKALAKEPSERYATANDMKKDLLKALQEREDKLITLTN